MGQLWQSCSKRAVPSGVAHHSSFPPRDFFHSKQREGCLAAGCEEEGREASWGGEELGREVEEGLGDSGEDLEEPATWLVSRDGVTLVPLGKQG